MTWPSTVEHGPITAQDLSALIRRVGSVHYRDRIDGGGADGHSGFNGIGAIVSNAWYGSLESWQEIEQGGVLRHRLSKEAETERLSTLYGACRLLDIRCRPADQGQPLPVPLGHLIEALADETRES